MYLVNKNSSITLIKNAKRNDEVKIFSHLSEDRIENINELVILKTKDINIVNRKSEVKKILIEGIIEGKNNQLSLKLKYKDIIIEEISKEAEKANNENMKERIINQIDKLNDTDYVFSNLSYVGDILFLPVKDINELRRKAINKLNEKIDESFKCEYKRITGKYHSESKEYKNEPRLIVKVNRLDQAMACVDCDIKYIITENEELYNELKNRNINVYYMNPRLSGKDVYCDINGEIISSIYNNVLNMYSVNYLHEKGVNVIGLSPELSKDEIEEIISGYKKKFKHNPNLMMLVYGRYEMMLMKYCPINKAYGYKNKGCLECMKHQYYLKDKKDFEFPLERSIDCNVKVLNSRITSLIDNLEIIINMGINNLLLDFHIENYKETIDVLKNYLNSFDKRINGKEFNSLTTHGAFNNGVE